MKPRFKAGIRGLLLKWWRIIAEQGTLEDHDVGISEAWFTKHSYGNKFIVRISIGVRIEDVGERLYT